jgi:hypothetical protein
MTERCYFKNLAESHSREGDSYKGRFNIDFQACLFTCSGYFGYGNCGNFVTRTQIKTGQVNLKRFLKTDLEGVL